MLSVTIVVKNLSQSGVKLLREEPITTSQVGLPVILREEHLAEVAGKMGDKIRELAEGENLW